MIEAIIAQGEREFKQAVLLAIYWGSGGNRLDMQTTAGELSAAQAAYSRGDLLLARRLLAQLLREDRNHLAGWRLLLRSLELSEHKQRAAAEILRLAPGDPEAMAVLPLPNPGPVRTGSRARIPAFGELSHDDDPFGELADFRARQGMPLPTATTQNQPLAQGSLSTAAQAPPQQGVGRPQFRWPGISFRWPRIQFRQSTASKLSGRVPWRTVAVVIGMGILLVGATVFFRPLPSSFSAIALPASPEELPHPALATIQYPTEKIQALGLDEPRRDHIDGEAYDLYHFAGVRGLLLSVDVISLDPLLDPVVEIYDPNGTLLRWNDNGNFSLGHGTLDSRLEIVLPEDGRYLISVGGIVGEGKYIISMRNH